MKKYIFFYKTINLANNKLYYGIHTTNNLEDGYIGCGIKRGNPPKKNFLFHRAVRKYGYHNFERHIILFFNNIEEAYLYEKCFITEDLIKTGNVYNTKLGGEGGKWDLQLRQKHIKLGTYKKTKQTKEKMSAAAISRFKTEPNPFKNKKHTKEARQKMSEHNHNKGKTFSTSEKQKLSKLVKDAWKEKFKNPHEKQKTLKHLDYIRQFSFKRALTPKQSKEIKRTYKNKRGQRAILVKKYNISYGVLERIFGKCFTHSKKTNNKETYNSENKHFRITQHRQKHRHRGIKGQ